MTKIKTCGNPQCSCSTGIHGGLTFGHGRLDEHGFWEFPCRVCAAAFDAKRDKRLDEIKKEVGKRKARDVDFAWARMEGWPYATTDIAQHTAEFQERLKEQQELDREWGLFFPEED